MSRFRGGFIHRVCTRYPTLGLFSIPMAGGSIFLGIKVLFNHQMGRNDSAHIGSLHDQLPAQIYNADRFGLAQLVRVVPYGVLGEQLRKDGTVARLAEAPQESDGLKLAIVDPAGLQYISTSPKGAAGAAGAIYSWLGLDPEEPFPEVVRKTLTHEGTARKWVYDGRPVIHCIAPDLRGETDVHAARRRLSQSYKAVLKQWAVHLEPEVEGWRPQEQYHNKRQPWGTLRVAPLAGGIFSGRMAEQLPELTFGTLLASFDELPREYRRAIMKRTDSIDICVFREDELQRYRGAWEQRQRKLEVWKEHNKGSYHENAELILFQEPPSDSPARIANM
eukprot:TRINITY_DN50360_c0_g1_i1.p1 TRINITY_DN50360_c0_g1~~TRINITY_DN50360_c0_g1_i1.p1  ORF type:complete len:361 (+),score=107.24 TRINITY_DN50360_c0_g1_i1:84-1085(+)